MERKKFDLAKPLFDENDSIEKILKKQSIGEYNNTADFFNIRNFPIGGHEGDGYRCGRMSCCEHSDGSGGNYVMTRKETIDL